MSTLGSVLDSIVTQFQAVAPSRTITRSFKSFANLSDGDLSGGRFTLKVAGVENYQNAVGLVMEQGTAKLVIYGQIKLPEDATGEALEEAELLMVEDVRSLAAALDPGLTGALLPIRHTQSQQVDHPYGWVAVECDFEQ